MQLTRFLIAAILLAATACNTVLGLEETVAVPFCTAGEPGCTTPTQCSSSEFESTPPASTTDRVCEAITECSGLEYQRTPPTTTSDRICAAYTACTTAQYETVAGNSTSDRVCTALTVCTADEYESTTPAAASDRVCTALTQCTADEFASTVATATIDRVCTGLTVCTAAEYASTVATETSDRACTALTACTAAEYASTVATETSDRTCSSVSTCSGSQYESAVPTATSDRICVAISTCTGSQYESAGPTARTDRVCSSVSTCSGLQYETAPPTATTDRVCTLLTVCTADEYASTVATATSDRACSALTVCSVDKYASTVATATSDRVCTALTLCTANEYASTVATATSDRVCTPLTVCTADESERTPPTATSDRVCGLRTVAVVAGDSHTCALLGDDTVKCWGHNFYGQLGQGDNADQGDQADEMGDNLPVVDLGIGRTAMAITAGQYHTCALLDDATVKCWGHNGYGQLGLGNLLRQGDQTNEMGDSLPAVDLGTGRTAVEITAGGAHTCALLDDSTVKCWGGNDNGELGQGDVSWLGDQANEMGDSLLAVDLGTGRTAVAIIAADGYTCALLDDATVKCWGNNSSGQLGQGDPNGRGDHANEMGDNLAAVDLGTGRTAVAITAGGAHTCAVLDDATVKCWGRNSRGELGLGHSGWRGDNAGEMGDNLFIADLGTGRTAVAITAGDAHTCAVLDDATVKCWGGGGFGALGLGDTSWRGNDAGEMGDNLPVVDLGTGRTAVAITTGWNYTCAVLDNATAKCWGENDRGQLGLGHTSRRGGSTGSMGDNLPAIDLDGSP